MFLVPELCFKPRCYKGTFVLRVYAGFFQGCVILHFRVRDVPHLSSDFFLLLFLFSSSRSSLIFLCF